MSNFANGLNFRQLEIFSAVVEAGSTTRSAIKLGLSQPAVSRNVAQLEKDLGFSLFDRSGGRLIPTEAALRLHAEVSKALTGIENVLHSTRDSKAPMRGKVSIAAVPSMSLSFLSRAVTGFAEDFPDVKIQFETRTSRMSVEMVADLRVDVGLVSLPLSHPGIRLEELARPRAVCVMPKGHPLTAKREIDISDLKGHNLIPMSRSHSSRHRLEELFSSVGIEPQVRFETSTMEMACALIESGLGVTVANEITANRHESHGVVVRPFKHDMNYIYAFAFPASTPPTEISQVFVTYLKNYLANWMKQSEERLSA
ncbi:LysR family transcriptional regulator [Sneathiella chinensis]|uniref:LysR family transcriptional regulator n=1 Tax=Sneathiella chinensis TaxID=349750 RepID=A0ABQ5U406_9PROT|nr:LysR family transcriptional regulator [Sneathiella chinensis]GLQ06902.1 LysR family transcriptional regulator [Sneathiella chinensis]